MSDVYLEALKRYLSGPEWRQSIDIFIASNCKYFANIEELNHQQHTLWKTFQDIVEAILEMALENVGGSLQQLEDAIDEVKRQPSRGPREDVVKDVLEQLLSFSDFKSFAEMMKNAHDQSNEPVPSEHIDAMLRMGFPIAAIEATLSQAEPGASLEELILSVSAFDSSSHKGAHSRAAAIQSNAGRGAAAGAGYHYDLHDSGPNSPRQTGGPPAIEPALVKFAREAREVGEEVDLNELNAKFAIADSVLESIDAGARREAGKNHAMLALVRWAEDMRLLLGDMRTAYEEQLPCRSLCFNCKDGLLEWYRQLEQTRLAVDQAEVAGSMLSDAELRRMAELDRIAAMGTADEQLLHSLISRHDHVSKDVEALHRQCGLLVVSDRRGVQREKLEELYFFLKEQVASGADLDSVADELHDRACGVVESSKGAEVVSLLLELHVMEDEQVMLQRRIQSIVGSPSGGAEGLQSGNVDLVYGSFGDRDSAALFPGDAKSEGKHPDERGPGPDKDGAGEERSEAAAAGQRGAGWEASMFSADPKHGDRRATDGKDSVGEPSAQSSNSRVQDRQAADEAVLAHLRDGHRAAIGQLRELLEGEKARRLRALDDKLLRRRALLQRTEQQKAHAGGEGGPALDALAEEQQRAVQETEEEIEAAQVALEASTDSLVSGLKKRCLAELAAARRKLATADGPPSHKEDGDEVLSEEEKMEARRAAAAALKERFERDHRALVESLEGERTKQRARVLKQLAAKRKARGGAGAEGALSVEEQREEAEALVKMNVDFDAMQAEALSKAHENALLALAGIHLSDSDLQPPHDQAGESEEDYLDDVAGSTGRGREWLQRVDRVKGAYLGASAELLQRLQAQAAGVAVMREEQTDGQQAFGVVAALLASVVTNAFDRHVCEEGEEQGGEGLAVGSSKPGRMEQARADTSRVRAGILEEFERAKRQLDEDFDGAQRAGRSKLNARLQKTRQKGGGGAKDDGEQDGQDGAEEQRAEQNALLERAVDDFLGGAPLPDLAAVYSTALSGATKSAVKTRRDSAEWAEEEHNRERTRIKSVHVEKEQSLLLELEATMAGKKRQLEERLRRKRDSVTSSAGRNGAVSDGAAVANAAESEQLLERAFERVSRHLRTLSKDQLGRLQIEDLDDFLERSAQGQQPSLPGTDQVGPLKTNATLLRSPLAAPADAERQLDGEGANGAAPYSASALQPVRPGPAGGRRGSGDQEAMAGEVRRISMEYSEEKQKLDLMMKIQQTRQRQLLQKKLFEKNQRKQQQMQQANGAGGAWDEEGEDSPADSKSQYNSIEIGANRGLAALKLRSPSSQQPAFKGLPAEAYQGVRPAGGGAGYSSGNKLQSAQSFALRGMDLGPMMRK